MTGNKGEWSELYVFLRLLSEGRIYAADECVKKIADVFYPVLKVIREEQKGQPIEYIIADQNVWVEKEDTRLITVPRSELEEKASYLFEQISNHTNSFEIEEIAEYMNGIKVNKIKAPSTDTTIGT